MTVLNFIEKKFLRNLKFSLKGRERKRYNCISSRNFFRLLINIEKVLDIARCAMET